MTTLERQLLELRLMRKALIRYEEQEDYSLSITLSEKQLGCITFALAHARLCEEASARNEVILDMISDVAVLLSEAMEEKEPGISEDGEKLSTYLDKLFNAGNN